MNTKEKTLTGFAEQVTRESVSELCCNIDDMPGEDIGFAVDIILKCGALDVWTTPIQMKKNRPGVLLTCLCRSDERENYVNLLFEHTTTLGVRERLCERYVLRREEVTRETPFGGIRFKRVFLPDGSEREKPEYEDLAELARVRGMAIGDVRKAIKNKNS